MQRRLSSCRELLIKLQAVFQLPKQLRVAIDQGAIEIAADKYADVAGILKHYGHKVHETVFRLSLLLRYATFCH